MSRRVSPKSIGDERQTPQWLVDELAHRYAGGAFDIDLAATEANKKAPLWLGPGSPLGDNGLDIFQWVGRRCYLNPPWSDIGPWAYAIEEFLIHRVPVENKTEVVVAVVPDRTSTYWWPIMQRWCEMATFIRGRLEYPGGVSNSSNPEGTAVFVFRPQIVAPPGQRKVKQ